MSGSVVRQRSSMTMPPRSPTVEARLRAPARRAARMPAENTTMSDVQLAAVGEAQRAHAAVGAATISRAWPCRCARRRPAPRCARAARAPPASSTCSGISRGANSTTCVSSPSVVQRVGRLEARAGRRRSPRRSSRRAAAGADRLEVLDACGRRSSPGARARDGGTNGTSRWRAPACRRGPRPRVGLDDARARGRCARARVASRHRERRRPRTVRARPAPGRRRVLPSKKLDRPTRS